jgi:hypothetical protein
MKHIYGLPGSGTKQQPVFLCMPAFSLELTNFGSHFRILFFFLLLLQVELPFLSSYCILVVDEEL